MLCLWGNPSQLEQTSISTSPSVRRQIEMNYQREEHDRERRLMDLIPSSNNHTRFPSHYEILPHLPLVFQIDTESGGFQTSAASGRRDGYELWSSHLLLFLFEKLFRWINTWRKWRHNRWLLNGGVLEACSAFFVLTFSLKSWAFLFFKSPFFLFFYFIFYPVSSQQRKLLFWTFIYHDHFESPLTIIVFFITMIYVNYHGSKGVLDY